MAVGALIVQQTRARLLPPEGESLMEQAAHTMPKDKPSTTPKATTTKPKKGRSAISDVVARANTQSTCTSEYVLEKRSQFYEVHRMVHALLHCMNIGRKTDQEFSLQLQQVHGVAFKKRAPRAIKEIKKFAELSMVSRNIVNPQLSSSPLSPGQRVEIHSYWIFETDQISPPQ